MNPFRIKALALILTAFHIFTSCASTGPKVSKAERLQKENEFNEKFLKATEQWLPRVYRIGYRLVSSPVPGHNDERPRYGFIGVGVDDLKDYARKIYGIDKSVKGVLVRGIYPGSKAENVDLIAGDVIQRLDGRKIKSLGSYFKAIRKCDGPLIKAQVLRKGQIIEREIPVEKVYYNAEFFLAATPDLDANAAFSRINVGIGAIRYCRNDDELAVIMGHELAHTTLKHSLKKMGSGIGTAVAFGVAAAAISAVSHVPVGSLVTNPMQQAADSAVSRRYEREADYFGMKHSFHAGYDVENGSKVFARLATDSPSFALMAYTFSSHPKTSERFLRLEKIIEEFKTKYPKEFEEGKNQNPDWELVIPVKPGETVQEALEKMSRVPEKPPVADPVSAVPSKAAA